MGAKFGLNFGWEHPLFFDETVEDSAGFARQPWWDVVGREARMLRENAGIIDISNFAKYRVAGPGAEDWLNALMANRMPTEVGRSCLTPLIGKRGGVAGDFTVTRLGPEEFWVLGGGAAERFHLRFFRSVPLPEGTTFESLTEAICGFNVAGPRARDLLARLTNADLSNEAFPFFRSQRITVAGVEVVAIRVSFTGRSGLGAALRRGRPGDALRGAAGGRARGGRGAGGQPGADVAEAGEGLRVVGAGLFPGVLAAGKRARRLIRRDKDFLNKDSWLKIEANAPREEMVLLGDRRRDGGCQRVGADLPARRDAGGTGILGRLRVFGGQVAGAGVPEGGPRRAGRDGARGDPGTAAHGAATGRGAVRSQGPAPAGQGGGGGTGGVAVRLAALK
jgi:dimethylglycine dehydrogenase